MGNKSFRAVVLPYKLSSAAAGIDYNKLKTDIKYCMYRPNKQHVPCIEWRALSFIFSNLQQKLS